MVFPELVAPHTRSLVQSQAMPQLDTEMPRDPISVPAPVLGFSFASDELVVSSP